VPWPPLVTARMGKYHMYRKLSKATFCFENSAMIRTEDSGFHFGE
jgi:hypothetical protein